MASGRHDYWYGMLPGKAALSINQTEWFVFGGGASVAHASAAFIDYDVIANYKLNIVGGIVSCNYPGINQFDMKINDITVWSLYYDQVLTLPFNIGASHILAPGDNVKCYDTNEDDVNHRIGITLFGFEEFLVGA